MSEPCILVVTALWPTNDQPSAGIFVRRRLEGVRCTTVGPGTYTDSVALRYTKLLWRALTARGRCSVVEAHVLFPTGVIGLLAARLRRIPLVVYAHGADVRETAQQNRMYRMLASLVARRAEAVATNSVATASLVRQLGRDPVVIPPGVDLERFRPRPRPRDGSVLYLGGMDPNKGWHVARDLADTVAGPGLRVVPPDVVPALMASHDVVLVPSRAEPFGLVAAEAIASGRWVVASNVDGLREVVTDGVNGTLVDDGDFARAVREVPDYDVGMVAATAERFDWKHHRDAMADLVRQVASPAR